MPEEGHRTGGLVRFTRGCSADSASHPYTDVSIAEFLGWTKPNGQASKRVRNALHALEAAEELDAPKEMAEITKGLSVAMQAR